jgi:hypothetical protein
MPEFLYRVPEGDRDYIEYLVEASEAPLLPPDLLEQVESVPISVHPFFDYRPCRVTLRDGRVLDRVYLSEVRLYYTQLVSDPHSPAPGQMIDMREVVKVEESPDRLPIDFANKMYLHGESSIGLRRFKLELKDGRELFCLTGKPVDFVDLPDGVKPADILELHPHARAPEESYDCGSREFFWCLYRDDREEELPYIVVDD